MAEEQKWQPKRRLDYKIMRYIIGYTGSLFFRLYGRWKVIGREHLPRTGPVIVAGNHASYVDPILGWCACFARRKGWGIARDDLWNNPVVGYLLDSIGVLPIRRNSPDRAALSAAIDLLAQGHLVGIFPEGTRTYDGLLNPAQPGIALIARKSGAPVVPIAMIGTYEMLPRKQKSLRRVPLTVVFGEPIYFSKDATREEVTERVMVEIAALMTAHGRPTESPLPERAVLLAAREKEEAK